MTEQELKDRTKMFALRVLNVVNALPDSIAGRAIATQLVHSGSSVAANYRAACICRTKAEFIAKLGIVLEEADESCFWLEFIADAKLLKKHALSPLLQEGNELCAIFTSSIRSARAHPTVKSKI